MNPDVFVFVMFGICAVLVLVWQRKRAATRVGEMGTAAGELGLQVAPAGAGDSWLESCPEFRMLASGLKKQVEGGLLLGNREGLPFSIVHYHAGSQTSHGSTQYLIFSTDTSVPSPSFSLVLKDSLDSTRDTSTKSRVDLTGWPALDRRTLWMHADPANPNGGSVPGRLVDDVNGLAAQGDNVQVEYLGGRFIVYLRHEGQVEVEKVRRLIDVAMGLLAACR